MEIFSKCHSVAYILPNFMTDYIFTYQTKHYTFHVLQQIDGISPKNASHLTRSENGSYPSMKISVFSIVAENSLDNRRYSKLRSIFDSDLIPTEHVNFERIHFETPESANQTLGSWIFEMITNPMRPTLMSTDSLLVLSLFRIRCVFVWLVGILLCVFRSSIRIGLVTGITTSIPCV